MNRLEWNVQYSVGIPKIDQQHAYLFELAHRLAKHADEEQAKTVVAETIAELHKYVESHFAYEEGVMKKAGYDHLEEHIKMHELMRTRLDLLTTQLKEGMLKRHDLIEFMESWLTEHIIMEDMRYIPVVAAMQQ